MLLLLVALTGGDEDYFVSPAQASGAPDEGWVIEGDAPADLPPGWILLDDTSDESENNDGLQEPAQADEFDWNSLPPGSIVWESVIPDEQNVSENDIQEKPEDFLPPIYDKVYFCRQHPGVAMFKGSSAVRVARDSDSVIVHRLVDGAVLESDWWSYSVVAEDKHTGFRAIRMTSPHIPSASLLDVIIAGDLILFSHKDELRLVATSINAVSAESIAAEFSCIDGG